MKASHHVEIQAHRGESFIAPENTMAAFDLAWKNDDDAIELDVHLTLDGKLIVSHDADTKRTGGEKLIIKEYTFEKLQAVDVGKWKGEAYARERMPLLSHVLEKVPAGKRVFVELKVGPEAVAALASIVRSCGLKSEQIVVISFHADALAAARRALPELKMYYLSGMKHDKQKDEWSPTVEELIGTAKQIGADGLDIQAAPPVDRAFVSKAKDAGLEVYAWTVDDPAEARRLIECGVDGITTNRAAWMGEQLNREG